jgi:hypothetical protein
MSPDDPFPRLAEASPVALGHAAAELLETQWVADFKERTGFVQYRNGRVPRIRRIAVEVDPVARVVRAQGLVTIYNVIHNGWAGGERAEVEAVLSGDEPAGRLLELVAAVPPGAPPVGAGERDLRLLWGALVLLLVLIGLLVPILLLFFE